MVNTHMAETFTQRLKIVQKYAQAIALAGVIFLLPFQTRWILHLGQLRGQEWEPLTRSVYVTEVMLWLVLLLGLAQKRVRMTTKLCLPLLFVLVAFLSFAWAGNHGIAEQGWLRLFAAVLFFLTLRRDPRRLIFCAWAWIAAAVLQSVLAVVQVAMQFIPASTILGMSVQDPSVSGVSVVLGWGGRLLRAYGTFPHPNILGGFLALSLFFLFWLAQFSTTRKKRILLSVAALMIPWALVLTFSRAALLASAVMLASVVLAIFTDHAKKLTNLHGMTLKYAWFFSLAIVSFFVAGLFYASPLLGRVDNENFYHQYSQTQRSENREQALSLVPLSWLHGVGIAQEPIVVAGTLKPLAPPEPLHNVFGLIGLELGIFGLLIFGVFVFRMLLPHTTALFSRKPSEHLLAFVPLGGWTALMILLFFDHYLWTSFSGVLMLWTTFAFLERRDF